MPDPSQTLASTSASSHSDLGTRPTLKRQEGSFFAAARERFRGQKRWKQVLEVTATLCTILGLPIAIIVPILENSAPAPAPITPTEVYTGTEEIKCGDSILRSTSGSNYVVEPSCEGAFTPGGTKTRGRWFALVGDGSKEVSISTCNSYSGALFDTRLRVYRGSSNNESERTCIVGNDDYGSCIHGSRFSKVSFAPDLGVTYLVLVDGRQPEGGDFVLDVDCNENTGPSPRQPSTPTPQPIQLPTSRPTLRPTTLAPTSHPTQRPTLDGDALEATVCRLLPTTCSDLTIKGTPQYNALAWMARDTHRLKTFTEWRGVQRYALGVIYYSMEGWEAPVWMTAANDECIWSGVKCSETGMVTSITLESSLKGGKLPRDVALLNGSLNELRFGSVGFTGTIPTEFGLLTKLTKLYLNENKLDGTVPSALGQLSKLQYLALSRNDLVGSMPEEVCVLRNANNAFQMLSWDCDEMQCDCCNYCCVDGGGGSGCAWV